ncbi:ribosomal maturation YjgA family protein [Paenibacillus sp. BAC0078]
MRAKMIYCCAVLIAIVLGLSSRAFGDRLPPFVASHLGDALWAAMVYFAFRVLLTRRALGLSLVLSLSFSYGIEFSQLYQTDWINGLRSNAAGGLILGKGFLWIDLLRYTVGIGLAYGLDNGCLSKIRN